jgi:hypothetical protein
VARKEVECAKKTSCVLKLQWNDCKSVVRIRLVKTENPSACVTMCRIAIALYYI